MKILFSFIILIASMLLLSCDVMQGVMAGMGGYGYGGNQFNPWNYYNGPAPQWSSGETFSTVPVVTTTAPVQSYSGSTSSSSSSTTSSSSSSSSGRNFCSQCANRKVCPQCGGTGKRTDNQFGTGQSSTARCGVCGGSGRCPYCK